MNMNGRLARLEAEAAARGEIVRRWGPRMLAMQTPFAVDCRGLLRLCEVMLVKHPATEAAAMLKLIERNHAAGNAWRERP